MPNIPNKRGLAEHVYGQLKQWLFESRFGQGGKLPVEELVTELGVSRQPMMDAMKRLEQEGFVSIIPQVGCKVREYTPEAIHDFFLLLASGEALVAELAAAKATSDDMVMLRFVADQLVQLSLQKPRHPEAAKLYRTLNRSFHTEIQRVARSASVAELVESMGDRADFFIAASGRSVFEQESRLKEAIAEHEEVLSAIAKRDVKRAGEAMRRHVLATDVSLQEFILGKKMRPAKKRAATSTGVQSGRPAPKSAAKMA